MFTKGVVVGQRVLRLPAVAAVGGVDEAVAELGLTHLIANGVELLVVVAVHVVGKAAHELQARQDVANLQARGGPDVRSLVVEILGLQQTYGVHGITVGIRKVGTVLGDVGRIFSGCTTVCAIERVVYGGTGRHIDS